MNLRTWPGMAGGLLLLMCGCQSANWFARNQDSRPPRGSSALADSGKRAPQESRTTTSPARPKSAEGEKIARTNPRGASGSKSASEWYAEGARLENTEQFAEARQAYERALEVDASFAEAHHRLAVIADRNGDFATADQNYARAKELKPADANLLSDMGYSLSLRKKDAAAEALLKQALAVDPNHSGANENLARVLVRQKKYEELSVVLHRIKSPDARQELARLLPDDAPTLDEIAQMSPAPSSQSADGVITSDQQSWLAAQAELAPATPAPQESPAAVANTAPKLPDDLPGHASLPSQDSLPAIVPAGQSGPAGSAAPLEVQTAVALDSVERPAVTGNDFWQASPLPGPETNSAEASVARPQPVAAVPNTQPAAGQIAALAAMDAGPGSLFPSGSTVTQNAGPLGGVSPWGNAGPPAAKKTVAQATAVAPAKGAVTPVREWPVVTSSTAASGVVPAGGPVSAETLPIVQAAINPRAKPQGDPLAPFQFELDQREAANRSRSLPDDESLLNSAPSIQQTSGTANSLVPWPAPATGTASRTAAPRTGSTAPWPGSSQTLRKIPSPAEVSTPANPRPPVDSKTVPQWPYAPE